MRICGVRTNYCSTSLAYRGLLAPILETTFSLAQPHLNSTCVMGKAHLGSMFLQYLETLTASGLAPHNFSVLMDPLQACQTGAHHPPLQCMAVTSTYLGSLMLGTAANVKVGIPDTIMGRQYKGEGARFVFGDVA